MRFLPGYNLGYQRALILCFMGKHGALNYVAYGINAFYACFQVIVNRYLAAALFHGQTYLIQSQTVGISNAPNRNQAIIAFQLLLFAFRVIEGYGYFLAFYGCAGHFMAQVKFNAQLLQYFLQLAAKPFVHRWN